MSLYQFKFRQIPYQISFFCNLDTRHRVSSFFSALEGMATQSKAKMKSSFIEVETAIKIKLSSVFEQLNQRHNQWEQVIDFEDDEFLNETAQEKELSTQFLQMQKPTNWFAGTLWALL